MASLGQFLAQAKFDLETYLQKLFLLPELVDNLRTISSHYCKNSLFSGIVEEVKLT